MGKPKGGYRPGAGRKPGVPNKATKCIKEIAEPFGEAAVGVLAAIMTDPLAPHPARVAAATALLDRGFGRPTQIQDVNLNDQRSYVRAPSKVSSDEWQQVLEQRQAMVEQLVPPKPKPVTITAKPNGNQKPSIQ